MKKIFIFIFLFFIVNLISVVFLYPIFFLLTPALIISLMDVRSQAFNWTDSPIFYLVGEIIVILFTIVCYKAFNQFTEAKNKYETKDMVNYKKKDSK